MPSDSREGRGYHPATLSSRPRPAETCRSQASAPPGTMSASTLQRLRAPSEGPTLPVHQIPLPLPLPDPPAELVARLLDELRGARRELHEAHRIYALLHYGEPDPFTRSTRGTIELATAEHRAQLWAAEVRRLEITARGLGLDVTSQL